jgi:hypothetical protein
MLPIVRPEMRAVNLKQGSLNAGNRILSSSISLMRLRAVSSSN